MKYIVFVCLLFLLSCNSGTTNEQTSTEIDSPHPSSIEPPSEAIPADMKIKHDSVVVPRDSTVRKDSMNRL